MKRETAGVRSGSFRVFEWEYLKDILKLFVEEYKRGQIFVDKKRIQVKEYPEEAAEILRECGFVKEVQSYALYK